MRLCYLQKQGLWAYCNDDLIFSPRRKARKEKNEQMCLSLRALRLGEKIYVCNENDFQSLEQPMDFQSIVVESVSVVITVIGSVNNFEFGMSTLFPSDSSSVYRRSIETTMPS